MGHKQRKRDKNAEQKRRERRKDREVRVRFRGPEAEAGETFSSFKKKLMGR